MKYASLPVERLAAWAHLNNVAIPGAVISSRMTDEAGHEKGGGIVATAPHNPGDVILRVPRELILSRAQIEQHAKVDRHLQAILDAVGSDFSQNLRRATLLFLLMQLVYCSPDFEAEGLGVASPLTDYVKFLPKEIPLPTFYTDEERILLTGTSLADAVEQKLKRLEQEFDHLRASTMDIDWCRKFWWNEDEELLTLEDWKVVDAIYRSRALELPRAAGDVMVPALDMANHASDNTVNARFDTDKDGNVLLVARDNASIKEGEEITIMYGCGGACEMIFSYGFLDRNTQSAREMFLDLSMASDDPLGMAKVRFAKEAPGVRVYVDSAGVVRWDSAYVWWACVNQEDGLDFQVVQAEDGDKELKAMWKNQELGPTDDFRLKLLSDPLKDVFLLRVTVLIQQRVELQGARLADSEGVSGSSTDQGDGGDDSPIVETVSRLRELEMQLLLASYQSLETEKNQLLTSDTVRAFLRQEEPFHQADAHDLEDFS